MTTQKTTRRFSADVENNVFTNLENGMGELHIKEKHVFLKFAADTIPLLVAFKNSGLTIQDAIDRLTNENVKTEIKMVYKGVNDDKFTTWKEKLFSYNENASQDERVCITQNLFLNLIGGNVTTLSKLYKDNEKEILEHNEKMGVELGDNRKLSSKIREEFGTLADWLKVKLS